jgi:protein-S-isoprenylcysteine O-methyltransferase Ste14
MDLVTAHSTVMASGHVTEHITSMAPLLTARAAGSLSVVFDVVAAGWWLFEYLMHGRIAPRQSGNENQAPDRTNLAVIAGLYGSIVAAAILGHFGHLPWPGHNTWPVITGIVLILLGIALRIWATYTLGRFFQFHIQVLDGQHIVTGGPYRFVRHPSYAGTILVMAGFGFASGDIWGLVAALAIIGTALAIRIRAEERMLTASFGAEYERFAAKRKRVLPALL